METRDYGNEDRVLLFSRRSRQMWEGLWRGFEGLGKDRQRIHNGRDGDRFANCNVIRQAKIRPVFKFPENGFGRCGKGFIWKLLIISK